MPHIPGPPIPPPPTPPPVAQVDSTQTTSKQKRRAVKSKALIYGAIAGGGILFLFVSLIVLSSLFRGVGRSKQGFYENVMKLAADSFKLSQNPSADFRVTTNKMESNMLKTRDATNAKIKAEVEEKRAKVERYRQTGEFDFPEFVKKEISNIQDDIEVHRKKRDKFRQKGKSDLVQYETKMIDDLGDAIKRRKDDHVGIFEQELKSREGILAVGERQRNQEQQRIEKREEEIRNKPYNPDQPKGLKEPLTVAELKSRLGSPDSIINEKLFRQVWIYNFSDGRIMIPVSGADDTSPANNSGDVSKGSTKISLNPHDIQMF
jgi:hypothetical protein